MDALHKLADEIREVFSDRGYRIDQATSLDPAFRRSRRGQSGLSRDMVLDTIDEAANSLGLTTIPVSGGGYDLQVFEGHADRRYRVRKATKVVDPEDETVTFDVIVPNASILDIPNADTDSFYRHERWIFGYTTDDSGIVDDIFTARAVRVTGDVILKLVMTDLTMLGTAGTTPHGSGFVPADEDDLPGFEADTNDTGLAGGTGA